MKGSVILIASIALEIHLFFSMHAQCLVKQCTCTNFTKTFCLTMGGIAKGII